MIITTQRSNIFLAIDTFLTAIGWIGFFYLFTRGVLGGVKDSSYQTPQMTILDPVLPTLTTLSGYLLVAAVNALLIVLWARYHKLFFKDLDVHRAAGGIGNDVVAEHFELSSNQLSEIQSSRVTVIYHATDGSIAHLETDQLQMQTISNPEFERSKVA